VNGTGSSWRARLAWGAAVVAAAVLLTLWASTVPVLRSDVSGASPAAVVSLTVVLFTALVGFATYTWRRFWRGKREGREPIVYDRGVFKFGLALGVAGTILGTFKDIWPPQITSFPDFSALLFRLVVIALVQVPVSLWIGYVWGRLMATASRKR
jgi:hypothetical protein